MDGIEFVKDLFQNWLRDNLGISKDEISMDDEKYYKDYFYANTCHVCHCLDRQKSLKRCSGCYMISYCGNTHQAKHWPTHKKLCKIIKEIISRNGGPSIFGKTKGIDKKSWTKLKANAMLIVSLKLGRDLYPSEKNMFKFPRACCVCHESDPNALINCHFCGNTSYCKDHISDSYHKSLCHLFISCYSLDLLKTFTITMTVSEIVTILLDSKPIDFIPYSKKIVKSSGSMRKFLDTYFNKIVNDRREKSRPEYWDLFISEYFTRPLTVISAMETIDFEPKMDFVIHILGSNNLELNDICAWEIILHWIPKIQSLKIVLIGPELIKTKKIIPICNNCTSDKKNITVEVHDVLYHHYMAKKYSKPSLVIGYNIGISEFENPGSPDDTWKPSIIYLQRNETIFILTAYAEEEAREEHKRICHFLGKSTNYFSFDKNQFASLKPVRDFETEGVFYQNNYMIIYKTLLNESEKV